MNTLKSIKYLWAALVMLGLTFGCTSTKQLISNGEYDDTYGTSENAPQIIYAQKQMPNYRQNQPLKVDEPQENQETTGGTEEYYDENYLNSRKINRNNNGNTGYDAGFTNGYRSGWNDYAWSQPIGWASPFNRFSMGNIGFGMGFGGFNRFYDPFWGGYVNNFYDPFWGGGFNSWYNPYQFNSFGYFNGGFGNNIFINNYYNSITSNFDGVNSGRMRTYGSRDGGSGSSTYNRNFSNTVTNDGGRSSVSNSRNRNSAYLGGRGNSADETSAESISNRSNSTNIYSGNNKSNSPTNTYYARPSRTENGSSVKVGGNTTQNNNTYTRPSVGKSTNNNWSDGSGRSSSKSSSESWSRGSSSWGGSGSSSSGSSPSGGGGNSRRPR